MGAFRTVENEVLRLEIRALLATAGNRPPRYNREENFAELDEPTNCSDLKEGIAAAEREIAIER